MSKNLLIDEVEVKRAIFTTFLFEEELLEELYKKKIPITLFIDRGKGEKGSLLREIPAKNMNMVYISKYGEIPYGTFHSKLILYEFDDRLRVVISSANLGFRDWTHIS
jgi:hypothetical protein